MTEVENISNWNTKQVINWFEGLDDCIKIYVPNLEESCITGAQLLALNSEDLNNLGIAANGHQELVLEATALLKELNFDLDSENLQSHALNLNCRCRVLRSSVASSRRNAEGLGNQSGEVLKRGTSIPFLRLAIEVLDSAKILVMWLDRPPFVNRADIRSLRASIVNLSYELSTTVLQTVFACVIEDAASSICKEMEATSNQLIVSSDALTIQPASLEVVHLINNDSSSGLGLFIKATFEGHHVITGTKEGSISSRIRRIAVGDEIVTVSGQTVIGWQLSKLVSLLKNCHKDVTITLKKRPHFGSSSSSHVPRKQQPERIVTIPPPISPISKVSRSRSNSLSDGSGLSTASSQAIFSPKITGGNEKKKLKKKKATAYSNIIEPVATESLPDNFCKSESGWYDDDNRTVSCKSVSPLDLLVIPPPPEAPYSPRKEYIARVEDEPKNSFFKPSHQKPSESPNSAMDTDSRRRFTVIGDEEMDEKWYMNIASELLSRKAKRQRRCILASEALEKFGKAKDDSVFYGSTRSQDNGSDAMSRQQKEISEKPVTQNLPVKNTGLLKMQSDCNIASHEKLEAMNRNHIIDELTKYWMKRKGSEEATRLCSISPPLPLVCTHLLPVPKPQSTRGAMSSESLDKGTVRMPSPVRNPGQIPPTSKQIIAIDSSIQMTHSSELSTKQMVMSSYNDLKKQDVKNNRINRLRSSPTSRSSYIAAIDVGYALRNIRKSPEYVKTEENNMAHQPDRLKNIAVQAAKPHQSSYKKDQREQQRSQRLSEGMQSQRRISCRDLGKGECDGWLWKKKTNTNSRLSSKWSKRWVVLKEGAIYNYHTPNDEKAESYIKLPGYKITPAPECKKQFAFRVLHPKRKTFYFASDRQTDMSRWMNKMGLAAIEYKFPDDLKEKNENQQDMQYSSESETEDVFLQSEDPSNQSSFTSYESSSQSSSPEKNADISGGVKSQISHSDNEVTLQHAPTKLVFSKILVNEDESESENKTFSVNGENLPVRKQNATIIKLENQDKDNKNNKMPESQEATVSKSLSTTVASSGNKPAISAEMRKHKARDLKRKQCLDIGQLSHSLELVNSPQLDKDVAPSRTRSEEELRHLKYVTKKKVGELAKREACLSASSSVLSQLTETKSGEQDRLFSKNVNMQEKGTKPKETDNGAEQSLDSIESSKQSSPKVMRRDTVGCPHLKVEVNQARYPQYDNQEQKASHTANESSIDDLCKALQHAEVDIHGVNRRTTLKRKMTILSRDPRKNNLLLQKRSLERQLKALKGELEYLNNLLERSSITSLQLHAWINQHPSLAADLGTIRRMSKIKGKPMRNTLDKIFEKPRSETNSKNSAEVKNLPPDVLSTVSESFVAENGTRGQSDSTVVSLGNGSSHPDQSPEVSSKDDNLLSQTKHENILSLERPQDLDSISCNEKSFSRHRPRSGAFSNCPNHSPLTENSSLTSRFKSSSNVKRYLETDL